MRRDNLRGDPASQLLEIVQQHQSIGLPMLISLAREKHIKGKRLQEGLDVLTATQKINIQEDDYGTVVNLSPLRIEEKTNLR